MKISEGFNLYRDGYILLKGQCRGIVLKNERIKKNIIELVGDKDLEDFSLEDIEKWVKSISWKELNSISSDVIGLRNVLRFCRLLGNKCLNYELVPVPKFANKKRVFLDESEVSRLIEGCDNFRDRLVVSLLYSSGIRVSEMLNLKRGDISNGKFSVIGKGGKERLCFVDERCEYWLDKYLDSRFDKSEWLFINRFGDKLSVVSVEYLLEKARNNCGLEKKVTAHTLRHSYATNFLRNDGNIRYLSELLGHNSVNTTIIYTHIENKDLEEFYKKYHSF